MNTDIFGLFDSRHFDAVIILLTICSGFLVKKFRTRTGGLCTAWRTLILSGCLVFVYTCIMLATQGLPESYWAKCFVSYTAATSLYELVIKRIKGKTDEGARERRVPRRKMNGE